MSATHRVRTPTARRGRYTAISSSNHAKVSLQSGRIVGLLEFASHPIPYEQHLNRKGPRARFTVKLNVAAHGPAAAMALKNVLVTP